jgi:hypothetical protein
MKRINLTAAEVVAIERGKKTSHRILTGARYMGAIIGAKRRIYNPDETNDRARMPLDNPFGRPGARLWVAEPWMSAQMIGRQKLDTEVHYEANGFDPRAHAYDHPLRRHYQNVIRENHSKPALPERFRPKDWPATWRAASQMPRWMSRHALEIQTVQVQRLHEITEEQAEQTGVELLPPLFRHDKITTYRKSFERNWNSDHAGDRDALWFRDGVDGCHSPWVWVIQFTLKG